MEDLNQKIITNKTSVRYTKAMFDGYKMAQLWTGKTHIIVKMDEDKKNLWPYYDYISLCGSAMVSKVSYLNLKETAWKYNRKRCKRCDSYLKKITKNLRGINESI